MLLQVMLNLSVASFQVNAKRLFLKEVFDCDFSIFRIDRQRHSEKRISPQNPMADKVFHFSPLMQSTVHYFNEVAEWFDGNLIKACFRIQERLIIDSST